MEEHLKHLQKLIPLSGKRILDLGAGKGEFTIVATKHGLNIIGIELNPAYIEQAKKYAKEQGVQIEILEGVAESLPFNSEEFDFANVSEVIEHVVDPEKMLAELYRVLKLGGKAYMSVPNRFAMKDPHYHLYFVNWLPRSFSEIYIALFGKSKSADRSAGHQKLNEMHYYTFGSAEKLFGKMGFTVVDIREIRILNEYSGLKRIILKIAYTFLRPVYFDTFHVLLTK